MKNDFTKIMNKNLNETNNRDYYQQMYGYKFISDKKEEKTEKSKEEHKISKNIDTEKLESEIISYHEEFEKIQANYNKEAEKISAQIKELELDIENETDSSKEIVLEKKKINYESFLRQLKHKYDFRVRSLNSKLSLNAKKELKNNDELYTEVAELDESFNYDVNLSILEKNMIFGNVLENVSEICMLSEADPIKVQKDAVSSFNKVLVSTKPTPYEKNQAKMNQNRIIANTQGKITDQKNALAANQDPISGDRLKEAADPNSLIAAKQEVINDKNEAIKNKEEQYNNSIEQQKKAVKKLQDNLDKIKKQTKIISSTQKGQPVETDTVTTVTESEEVNEKKLSKISIDFNNFDATFYKGDLGKLIKYAVTGQDTGVKGNDMELYQNFMKNNSDVQVIIKKIAFYVRKFSSGLSYEDTIQLKILKTKFNEQFEKAKEERAKIFR